MKNKKSNKGFTLVELLVVIAIIGILAVVAVPALFKNIEKGKVADLEADISAIRSAALSVYADTSELPSNVVIKGKTEVSQKDNTLGKELEGLSNPFDATYETIGVDTSNPEDSAADMLLLKITVSKEISESGAKKLLNDLGDKYVSYEEGKNTVNPIKEVDAITENTPIYISLISK